MLARMMGALVLGIAPLNSVSADPVLLHAARNILANYGFAAPALSH